MKKIIISEVISVILVLGIFLIAFTQLNGWEKTGLGRYTGVFLAILIAGIIVLVVTIVIFDTAALAALAVAPVFTLMTAFLAIVAIREPDAFVWVAFVAIAAVFSLIGLASEEMRRKINAPKKTIWLLLSAEALAIIIPILLITFR